MIEHDSDPGRRRQPHAVNRGLRLGTLAGIEIRLDSSLIIIFALLVSILGGSVFPGWHPEWGTGIAWFTAAAAGILFFASVLLHELAHSMVAKHFGITVPRITLFLFGGLAEIQEEPRTPRTEFLVAVAGPVASLALGLLFTLLANNLAGPEFARLWPEDQEAALAQLSPAATLLFWLGPINILLGLFNLVPGFPLDGGRVLRAAIWWITGDLYRATRMASDAGRLFGWMLMVLGAVQVLSGLILQGLWLLMIGWFLANAASASYRQLLMREALKGVTARDLMRSRFETLHAGMAVADFVDNHLLQSPQILWPVVGEAGQLVGLITLEEVKSIPDADRRHVAVTQVMRTDLSALTLGPDTDASRTMLVLGSHSFPLAVVEDNRVIGLLSQVDAMKWLLLHQTPH